MHPAPKTHQAPTEIAPDTFVVHDHHGEGQGPVMVGLNTMVIRAEEPVVVDTGVPDNQDQFLADVFGLVEPEDIRWVFISHDDIDHTGNINALMDLAPNATLIVNWFMVDRMGSTLQVPMHRTRWIGDGESFRAGDRLLHAVRPPVYDSPTTRGLFDTKTGVYWGSDSFGAPMTELVTNAGELDRGFWTEGMAMFNQYVSPWYDVVDAAKFHRTVDRIERLGVTAIASCHGPSIDRLLVPSAFESMRSFLDVEVPPMPGQEVLDQILASMPPEAVAA